MSADARVARAIIEVRALLTDRRDAPNELREAVLNLIDEAKDAIHLTDNEIEGYR